MDQTVLQQDIAKVIGLDTLPEAEKVALLDDIGAVILESAIVRLTAELSEDQASAFEQYLDTHPDADALMKHLMEHHSNFETILTEEIAAFKEEAIAVMGD